MPSALVTISIAILFLLFPMKISNPLDAYGLSLFVTIALVTAIVFLSFLYAILCRNLMMKSLVLSNVVKFDSEIGPLKYVWINISNLVVIILSLSLMLPWAKVRLYTYLANCSKIELSGDLDKFVDEINKDKSSFGEELAEIEGFEVTI